MSNKKGFWMLVLHAHLPFIRHPEFNDFLEEDWLFEAMTETYIPILDMANRLYSEGVRLRFTMSLTPTLCNMMADPLLQDRYRRNLNKLRDLAEKEVERTAREAPQFHESALMYRDRLNMCHSVFEGYQGQLIKGFKDLQDRGAMEILTCTATHAFLPLMAERKAVRAQVQIAVEDYARHFGRSPKGIWLGECAYNPGDDEILKEFGIRYFFLEAHGLLYGRPRPKFGTYAPVYCRSGVAAFARDVETAQQVWSAEMGYPGDPRYRDFYRDLGYDAPLDYIKPYLHEDGIRRHTGFKYHRVTGAVELGCKEPYSPSAARNAAGDHAGNFVFNRGHQVNYLKNLLQEDPLIVSMYDAELFGHWWFEGPQFLEDIFRKMHYDQDEIECVTPMEYLSKHPHLQVIRPEKSSWGDQGYFDVWLSDQTEWIYPHLHMAAERMVRLAERFPGASGVMERALNQAARELVLAQGSDWAFLITVGTAAIYAQKRTRDHLNRFNNLFDQVMNQTVDVPYLEELERRDNLFPRINYRAYTNQNRVTTAV